MSGCYKPCGHDGEHEYETCEICGLRIAKGISHWMVYRDDKLQYEYPCKCETPVPVYRFATTVNKEKS